MKYIFNFVFLLFAIVSFADAHELRPAYLELREIQFERYDILWKVPSRGEGTRLGLNVQLPKKCVDLSERISVFVNGAFIQRWSVKCPDSLSGSTITIDGLSATLTDVLVRLEHLNGTSQVNRLTSESPSFVVQAVPGPFQIVTTYLKLGVEHILLGIDHLLFVLALVILVSGWHRLAVTITAFTVAHSITLAAATLGFVNVPGPPVEAIIALSIVFVASEIVRSRQGDPGMTEQNPWVVAFIFGLLHGFGFAGALSNIGLPQQAIPLALLFFNVGVELGQLLFVLAVLSILAALRRVPYLNLMPNWTWRIPPYVIGSLAMFWVIQRISIFL